MSFIHGLPFLLLVIEFLSPLFRVDREVRETNPQPFHLLLEKSRGIELTRLASRARSPGVQTWVTQGHREELQEGDTKVDSALHPCLGWGTFLRLELRG